MQLRHKFFLALILLTSIPLLILLFGAVDQMEKEMRSRTSKELHVALNNMSNELKLIIDNQKSIARGLAQDVLIRQFASTAHNVHAKPQNPQIYKQQAEHLETFFLSYQKAVPDIQALRFMDNNGRTLVKVKEGKPVEPRLFDEEYKRMFVSDQSNKSFFKQAKHSNLDVIMSDFEMGQLGEKEDFCPAMVRYTARIKDEVDRNEGLLVINMWGTRLDTAIQNSLGGYPGNAYLVEVNEDKTRDGIYLYHPDSQKRFADQRKTDYRFNKSISHEVWNQMQNSSGNGEWFMDDGRMFFYRTLIPYETRPNVRWLLVLEVDSNTILAPVITMRHSIWILMGVLAVISLIVSIWAAWRLTRPAHNLAETITRYADGEHQLRYEEGGKDEICLAGKAFNYLVAKLQETEAQRDQAETMARNSERLASVGQLAAGIGHEINNPLMNMMSLATLIEGEVKDVQVVSDVQLLKKEGERCARIVQGILSFARERKPQYEILNMHTLILDTLKLMSHRLAASDIKVITELENELMMVGDTGQLQQVLVNIMLNAVQASPAGGSISISAKKDIDYIAILITDSGSGVRPECLNKVFDPFFTTKAEGEGTGLGLSVSYGIVRQHQGTIHIENTLDAGLQVMILLPIHVPDADRNDLNALQQETEDAA